MLNTVGVESLQELVNHTVPDDIRLDSELDLPEAMSENEFASHIQKLGNNNKLFKSYIGMGYHPTSLPAVIQRNIFENPSWYTSYTPYQAEISQGRLEALLNFQTMVSDLTGMDLANSSLLDEGTAAAEAMAMCRRLSPRESNTRPGSMGRITKLPSVPMISKERWGPEPAMVAASTAHSDPGATRSSVRARSSNSGRRPGRSTARICSPELWLQR